MSSWGGDAGRRGRQSRAPREYPGARRSALRLAVAASMAVFALAAPATTLAAGNVSTTPAGQALTPGLPQAPVATPTTTQPQQVPVAPVVTSTTNAGGSISGAEALLLALGAAIVLLGVAYFIFRDSRHHASLLSRVGAATRMPGDAPTRGSKAPHKSRKLSAAEKKRRKRGRAR